MAAFRLLLQRQLLPKNSNRFLWVWLLPHVFYICNKTQNKNIKIWHWKILLNELKGKEKNCESNCRRFRITITQKPFGTLPPLKTWSWWRLEVGKCFLAKKVANRLNNLADLSKYAMQSWNSLCKFTLEAKKYRKRNLESCLVTKNKMHSF